MPKLERLCVAVDRSADGQLAARLSGLFIGTRQLTASVLDLADSVRRRRATPTWPTTRCPGCSRPRKRRPAPCAPCTARRTRGQSRKDGFGVRAGPGGDRGRRHPGNLVHGGGTGHRAHRGPQQGGRDQGRGSRRDGERLRHAFPWHRPGKDDVPRSTDGARLSDRATLRGDGRDRARVRPARGDRVRPRAVQRGSQRGRALNILLPITGSDYSLAGAEVAVAIAKGSGARLTALHVSQPPAESDLLRRPQEVRRRRVGWHGIWKLGPPGGRGRSPCGCWCVPPRRRRYPADRAGTA